MIERFLFVVGAYAVCAMHASLTLVKFLARLRFALAIETETRDQRVTPFSREDESRETAAHEVTSARHTRPGWYAHRLTIAAIVCTLVAHVPVLVAPRAMLTWNQALARLLAFELLFFAVGVAALIGSLSLAIARARGATEPWSRARLADSACLGLLLVTVISGLTIATAYRWASSWSTVALVPYVWSLARLQPDVAAIAVMPYVVRLHVLSSLALIGCLPFTSASDRLLDRLASRAARVLAPAVEAIGDRWRRLDAWARQRGQQVLWPEQDE